jgi:hypothetical protein
VKMLWKPPVLDNQLLSKLTERARQNWEHWRDSFEHAGPISQIPVLADGARFRSFLADYYVGRTIRKGKHDEFRRELVNSGKFEAAICDESGQSLDRLEAELRPRFGSKDGKNRLTSVLSKLAAFIRPERFVAWDRFAKKGLNIVQGRSASFQFRTYSDYLSAFDAAWKGQPGMEIRDYVTKVDVQSKLEREARFQRRVLDMYLMECGGRWSPNRGRKQARR